MFFACHVLINSVISFILMIIGYSWCGFTDEEMRHTKRHLVICPRSHSCQVTNLGFALDLVMKLWVSATMLCPLKHIPLPRSGHSCQHQGPLATYSSYSQVPPSHPSDILHCAHLPPQAGFLGLKRKKLPISHAKWSSYSLWLIKLKTTTTT